MNRPLLIILLIILIAIIIYVVVQFNKSVQPYTPSSVWQGNATFEGFSSMMASTGSFNPFVYSSPTPKDDLPNKDDPFGLIEGSPKCAGSGFGNLHGNICMNQEQYRLLTTRGGNATTGTYIQVGQ